MESNPELKMTVCVNKLQIKTLDMDKLRVSKDSLSTQSCTYQSNYNTISARPQTCKKPKDYEQVQMKKAIRSHRNLVR